MFACVSALSNGAHSIMRITRVHKKKRSKKKTRRRLVPNFKDFESSVWHIILTHPSVVHIFLLYNKKNYNERWPIMTTRTVKTPWLMEIVFAYHAQYLQKYTEVYQIHVNKHAVLFMDMLPFERSNRKKTSFLRPSVRGLQQRAASQHAGSSTELQLLIQCTFYASDDSQCSFISFLQQQWLLWPFL